MFSAEIPLVPTVDLKSKFTSMSFPFIQFKGELAMHVQYMYMYIYMFLFLRRTRSRFHTP